MSLEELLELLEGQPQQVIDEMLRVFFSGQSSGGGSSGFGYEAPNIGYAYNPPFDPLYPQGVPPSERTLTDPVLGYQSGYTPEFRSLTSRVPLWNDPASKYPGYYGQQYIHVGTPPLGRELPHEYGHAFRQEQGVDLDAFEKAVNRSIGEGAAPGVPWFDMMGLIAEFPGIADNSIGENSPWGGPTELYADIIARSGGDLNQVPPTLRPFFDKALSFVDQSVPAPPFMQYGSVPFLPPRTSLGQYTAYGLGPQKAIDRLNIQPPRTFISPDIQQEIIRRYEEHMFKEGLPNNLKGRMQDQSRDTLQRPRRGLLDQRFRRGSKRTF